MPLVIPCPNQSTSPAATSPTVNALPCSTASRPAVHAAGSSCVQLPRCQGHLCHQGRASIALFELRARGRGCSRPSVTERESGGAQVERIGTHFKQRADRFYPAWAFVLPTTVMRLVYSAIESTVFTCIVRALSGPQGSSWLCVPARPGLPSTRMMHGAWSTTGWAAAASAAAVAAACCCCCCCCCCCWPHHA